MKTVSAQIDDVDVLIEALPEAVEIVGPPKKGRKTITTGIQSEMAEAYSKAKETIGAIARDVGTKFGELQSEARPKQLEMEFSMGFSASAGLWVLTTKGDSAFKIKMTWEFKKE